MESKERKEPIPLPVRESAWSPLAEKLGERAGFYACQARSRSRQLAVYLRFAETRYRRWSELVRVAKTSEGRQRNVVPLLVFFVSASFLLGAGVGLVRK